MIVKVLIIIALVKKIIITTGEIPFVKTDAGAF